MSIGAVADFMKRIDAEGSKHWSEVRPVWARP